MTKKKLQYDSERREHAIRRRAAFHELILSAEAGDSRALCDLLYSQPQLQGRDLTSLAWLLERKIPFKRPGAKRQPRDKNAAKQVVACLAMLGGIKGARGERRVKITEYAISVYERHFPEAKGAVAVRHVLGTADPRKKGAIDYPPKRSVEDFIREEMPDAVQEMMALNI